MRTFDFETFKKESSDKIEEILKEVPDEWKSEVASFIILQSAIFGAVTMFEGIGILEWAKLEYIDVCENIDDENEEDIYLN